ncbi:hypothetical protein TWF225_007138 [Orbilia oligospora]|uniref:Uncharacterized protein n=1 Tax=Orbilia oligospora TaxID=2813651 RepID=A0A7C8PEG2_ORBOL|nr:hypothetical protein TWF751_009643 [Orbilia oligospora]KAF3180773.1 hypothetical protein TWF225_007138 [Orbilia oligospora]KAF3236306.1 hypothetical protein TWF217_002574 [Orbilia oligospora]KAF3245994.1 hypothetical protein TWF128_009332 [Orbilia oligospora]KAF3245995.1 hypothetical protein TWF128_009332 [Orbilia oligospora]
MASPSNRRPSEPSPSRYSSNSPAHGAHGYGFAGSSASGGNAGLGPSSPHTQHIDNAASTDSTFPVDNLNIEPAPVNSSRRFFPRRPVGSRPNRLELTQSIPSVVSSTGGVRNSRASTVSAASRPPTIRLRRLPSNPDLNNAYGHDQAQTAHQAVMAPQSSMHLNVPLPTHTRPRSLSDPARHSWLNDPGPIRSSQIMSPVQEVPPDFPPTPPPKIPFASNGPPVPPKEALEDAPILPLAPTQRPAPTSRFSSGFSVAGARNLLGMKQRMEDVDRMMQPPPRLPQPRREYNQDVVDLLDVIDPEVSTLSTLTNVQNSLFIPNLGSFINRHPTYDLSSIAGRESRRGSRAEQPTTSMIEDIQVPPEEEIPPEDNEAPISPALQRQRSRALSITSNLTDSHYAVLPHGVTIDDWTEEERAMLDDHVRHLLHSKREKFKRGWRGFKQYVKRPLGLFVTIYATLITLFGLAWVLFLIGWIYVGEKQLYVINVIDNVLVALFAIVGDGLAPFRVVDTYHMIFIARYHFLTWKLRRKRKLPELQDRNDLPTRQFVSMEVDRASVIRDLEASWEERDESPVLNEKQQERFEHHSMKFAKSHTYYRPHETRTHFAFPVKLLITVTILLDFHSMFQITLGGVTWGISYHHRPAALTATILSCSIACNIAAGITISIGDRMTRKKRIIEQEFRQGLTEEAIGHVKKKVRKEKEKAAMEELAGTASTSADALGGSNESSRLSLLVDEKEKEKEKDKSRSRSK